MRESLTVLAILIIAVLTTALVGPYFVDWNAHRGEIEQRLSRLLGATVTVAGPIDVKLLPRPIFHLQDVSVQGQDPAAGSVAASSLDMELSLTSLMRGEILFVEADATSPVVTLPIGGDGSIRLPQVSAADADRISLVHFGLRDGTIVLRGQDGRPTFTATGIAGEGEATSLAGPFKFNGQIELPRGPLVLHVGTGSIDDGRMRLKGGVEVSAGMPKVDVDGIVTTSAAGAGTQLGFDGQVSSGGSVPLAGTILVVPWRLTAKLHAEAGTLEISDGELRAGADARALIAALSGHVASRDKGGAALKLHARQFDITRLAVPPDQATDQPASQGTGPDAAVARATPADGLGALTALLGTPDLTAALPFPIAITADAETISAGELTLTNLVGAARIAGDQPLTGSLAIGTTDGARLKLDGTVETGPGAVFKGRVEAIAPHVQRLKGDLAASLPAFADALRQPFPFDTIEASGVVDLSNIGFAAHDVEVSLDRSKFAGTVTLTRAVGPDRARLFADLTSDALDLDAVPDWRDATKAAGDLDISLTLVAHALRVASTDAGRVSAGRIALQLNKTGSDLSLDRLSIADLGGATAEITGHSDGKTAHAEGRLDAGNLRALAALVDRLMPGPLADRLLASNEALSPALLAIAADGRVESDGSITPRLLTIAGTMAATRVDVSLRPDDTTAPSSDSGGPPAFALSMTLNAPDAAALMRQAGLATAQTAAIGRGRLELAARRDKAGTLQGTFSAALGDTSITADGHGERNGRVVTRVAVRAPNVAPLARALLLATPEAGAVWPIEASGTLAYADRRFTTEGLSGKLIGTGFKADLSYAPARATSPDAAAVAPLTGTLTIDRLALPVLAGLVLGPLPQPKAGAIWPDAPFAPATVVLPRGDIALTVPALPLMAGAVAQNVKARLRLAPGTMTLADLSATLGDGRVGGTLTLRRDGGTASLNGHLEWSGLPIASASLGGRSGGALDLASTGDSVAATVASLAGSGTLVIDDARLPRFDPTAIPRVIGGADTAEGTIDDVAIGDSLAKELDRGALSLGTVTTPVTVAAGTIRVAPVRRETPPVRTEAAGSLDLGSLLLSLRATASLVTPPKDWVGALPQVGVIWKGPFAAPARDIDAATLVNGIAARAIARDQARIEAFQDDIRERAFFARRLRAIEADQQAARDKARADAEAADRQRRQQFLQGVGAAPSSTADAVRPSGQATPDAGGVPLPTRRPTPKPLDLH